MSAPAAFQRMVDSNIRALSGGLKVTLRRTSSLKNRVTGKALGTLSVASAALAGAAAINLTGMNLDGELVLGAKFTIAGHAATYTTTESTEASKATNDVLVDVGISPVLEAPAAQGAVVTITQAYSDQRYSALRGSVDEGLAEAQIEGRAKRIWLSALGAPRVPRRGDILIDGSESDEVTGLGKSLPGAGAVGWLITTGKS